MNVFLTEHNVDLYLTRLHTTRDAQDRDGLLRLLVQEEDRMGESLEHLENGQRRVAEGAERIKRQRAFAEQLSPDARATSPSAFFLETFEKTQALLEAHVEQLRKRVERSRL